MLPLHFFYMSENPPGPPGVHGALTRNTGFLISRMGMVAQKHFQQRIEQIGLTPRMWGALNVLDAEGTITQHALGKCTGVDPSTVVATIDGLEQQGLVQRRPHATDRRAYALHITERGRQTLTRGRVLARRAQEDLLACLSTEEQGQLHALMLRLVLATASPQVATATPPGDPARVAGSWAAPGASATPTPSTAHVTGSSRKSA